MAKRRTTDALEIIDAIFFKGRPEMYAELERARERLRLAERLHELREAVGLTQQELADKAETSRTVIARLERPGYERHTMSTLRRVAAAMGYDVKVDFVPSAGSRSKKVVAKAATAASRKKLKK